MVQPQPQAESALQWEMTGEDAMGAGGQGSLGATSHGSLRVPPELASNEVVHRLLVDNHQLREALRRSNDALRERCEEMIGWQRKSREERDFLSCRFREARSLVERLAQENQSLLSRLSQNKNTCAETESQLSPQELKSSCSEGNGLQHSPQDLEVERKRTVETHDAQTVPPSLADSSMSSYVNSVPHNLGDSPPLSEGEGEAGQPYEGANGFLQLLKNHKEKLEEDMKELRRKNKELEKENAESEQEKARLRLTVEQLRCKLTQLSQSGAVMEESVQCSDASSDSSRLGRLRDELQATQERYRELQEKLDSLEKSSMQRDRTEALLKQKDKDCAQLTKDSEALKAQVTSLLGELHERQKCLERSEAERQTLEEKLCGKTETLQTLEKNMEEERKQHSVTVDELLLNKGTLESALKNDRMVITEERRKLAQLQHAYTCLFQDYDSRLKMDSQAKQRCGEVEDLTNRLAEAEKALALKQELIDKLKEEVEQQRGSLETVPVLNAQAEIYKADFLAEREAREKLNQKKEELQEQLEQARAEIEKLKQAEKSRAQMGQMQQRHLNNFRHLPAPAQSPMYSPAQPSTSFRDTSEIPDLHCPKCQYLAPDMDTLQIHVMDCIQ
ncbi:NF-kappa-B essential modulator isoform X2 [Denticeps clupeoides]|uniref:NF-kappa-B essential modulator n=1 Tax=Denticeps clupeoides TaxID=299321 RepID=A0AAY4B5M7_9TELE|nr:NF-kappa-B essential modulator isoform X2 [Denticeps clupeoides]